jgi:pimeloyl-ACP methyl ester carboxylesterase
MSDHAQPTIHTPRARHEVRSPAGNTLTPHIRLSVQEWGHPDGPAILFVHAWSQSHLGWVPQLTSPALQSFRLVTFDLRGHGESDKPSTPEAYADDARWGDDVHAVVQSLGLRDFTLVGWSLGGLVALDYLRQHGGAAVRALNLVAGANAAGNDRGHLHFGAAAAHAGAALGHQLSAQLAAMLALQQALVHRELSVPEFGMLFAQSLVAAPAARAGLLSRHIDHEPTLRAWHKPLLLSHGEADQILTLRAAQDALSFAPHAKLSVYANAGHAPQWEDPERFNRELAALASANRA